MSQLTLLICTTEQSGMDRYSQAIASFMPGDVDVVHTERYNESWLQVLSRLKKRRTPQQLIHFPNQHFGHCAVAAGPPFLITVHDLARICLPLSEEIMRDEIDRKFDIMAIQRAAHLIAVSQNTKNDLMKHLGIAEEKISVVYNGVNHDVFRSNGSAPFNFPYILFVGSERPRKNLGRLLAAFAKLKKSGKFSSLKLVKVGNPGSSTEFRQNTLRAIKDLGIEAEVILAGHVSDHELSKYYSSASALVYPSLYEGFGLPVIEAMACNCPVIASNVSSLPEVAGDAALLVDAHDVAGLAQAMARMLTDADLRKQSVAKGQERSRRFSWAGAAAATLAIYRALEASAQPRTQREDVVE